MNADGLSDSMADLSKKEWEKYDQPEQAEVYRKIANVMKKDIKPDEVADFYNKWADNNEYEKVCKHTFILLIILNLVGRTTNCRRQQSGMKQYQSNIQNFTDQGSGS